MLCVWTQTRTVMIGQQEPLCIFKVAPSRLTETLASNLVTKVKKNNSAMESLAPQ